MKQTTPSAPVVRAKFFVTDIRHHHTGHADGQSAEVVLAPVYGSYPGGDEQDANADWSRWTPSGELKMTITNMDAVEQFALGKPYYIDFTPAD